MNRISIIRTTAFAAIALALAACDASHEVNENVDPLAAHQLARARADHAGALAEKVKKALGVDEGSAYGVEVTVSLGTVHSNAERKRFATIAAGVIGVRALDNRLVVDAGA